jgi:ubiquinone/menaquinone biosynthesis C-methylase UbiE
MILSGLPKLYTDFAKYYDQLESQYRDYGREAKWIQELLNSNHSARLIDISCGTGKHLEGILEPEKQREYVAMDVSQQMIRLTKQRLGYNATTEFLIADFLEIPFRSNSFDSAICMYWSLAGLDHSQVKQLFREVVRILEPSGLFIFDVENSEGIKENLLNSPFIDAFFFDPETSSNVIRVNFSRKTRPDVVDWRAYYLIESDGVSELINDELNLRFYSQATLQAFLVEAGFKVLQVSSSPGGKYETGSPSLYIVAQRTK